MIFQASAGLLLEDTNKFLVLANEFSKLQISFEDA